MQIVFTKHAKDMMKKRNISEDEVISAIKYPEITYKEEGLYYAQKNIGRANIEIVYERDKYIKVVTIYFL